jgi:hypothetical protein
VRRVFGLRALTGRGPRAPSFTLRRADLELRSCGSARVDSRRVGVGLDFDQHVGMNQAPHLDHRRCRRRRPENLPMSAGDLGKPRQVSGVDLCANDVNEGRTGSLERGGDISDRCRASTYICPYPTIFPSLSNEVVPETASHSPALTAASSRRSAPTARLWRSGRWRLFHPCRVSERPRPPRRHLLFG